MRSLTRAVLQVQTEPFCRGRGAAGQEMRE